MSDYFNRIPLVKAPETIAIPVHPNEVEDLDGFRQFINTNSTPLTASSEFSLSRSHNFLKEKAKLGQEEITQILRWTAHTLYMGASFGFPTLSTYFTSPNGIQTGTKDLDYIHPIRITNAGLYLQHILLQLHSAYTSTDSMDRDSHSIFANAVKAKLAIDPTFERTLQTGFIKPKQGIISVAGSGDIERIDTERAKENLGAVEANWNLVGGYQSSGLLTEHFKYPHENFRYILENVRYILEYANYGDTCESIDIDYEIFHSAAIKIEEATKREDPLWELKIDEKEE